MGTKKVYVKIDKEIEPGDLVRCMEHDWPFKDGDIRKVDCLGADSKTFFYAKGSEGPHGQEFWQPVHKLQIGDRVICHRPGVEKKPWAVRRIDSQGSYPVRLMQDYPRQFIHANACELELYQPEKHEGLSVPSENLYYPVDIADDLLGALDNTRRKTMRIAVAEMIVELLDREVKEECPQSFVLIGNWRDFDKTVTASSIGNKPHTAKLSPNDTWDTLTGVYVTLCKATGRKLPEWIYGRETK